MYHTLKDLQDNVNNLIRHLGEEAPCAAWIYTPEDCYRWDENDDQVYPCEKHPELAKRILTKVSNTDHIYEVIQECVEDMTEEQYMLLQQELV